MQYSTETTQNVTTPSTVESESYVSMWMVIAAVAVAVVGGLSLLWWIYFKPLHRLGLSNNVNNAQVSEVKPASVNYHFTRQCNYQCGFCFHTAKTSFVLPIDKAKQGLKLLKEAGK